MGGAFYGLSDDEYAHFYNPAGLSLYRTDGQTMLSLNAQLSPTVLQAITTVKDAATGSNKSASSIADKLTQFQGTPLYAGITPFFPYYVHKHFALGLLVGDTKLDFALLGRDIDTTVELTAISDSGLIAGYATDFLEETLHIGMNVKGILRGGGKKSFSVADIAQKDSFDLDPEKLGGVGAGVDFDLGGTYELPDIPFAVLHRASLVFNNILGSPMSISKRGDPPGLTRTVSLGYHAVFPGISVIDNVHALIDFAEFRLGGEDDPEFGATTGSFWKHVNIGVEAPLCGWFIPRVGIHQGYLTAGFGVNLRALRLDFATYAEELSSSPGRLGSRRVALRLQIGMGAAPPSPITNSARNKPVEGAPPPKAEDKAATTDAEKATPKLEEKKKEEPRKPQGMDMEPGPMLNPELGTEGPAFPNESGEVPRVEGNGKDRFNVEKPAEEPSVAP